MARKQVRLSTEELHELKQLMGALLALLSFWSLASLDIGSQALICLGALVAATAFVSPRLVSRIPPSTWFWAGPVMLLLIVGDFILHIPEFIPPLMRMVVLLIIYRMLAPRKLREDLQVILLCLFCVVISGVLTVSLLFAFQILLFAPLAMAMLFIVCLLDRGEEAEAQIIDWRHFSWPRLLRRVWQVVDLRIFLLCSAMFAMVVAVSTLLFILTPRFDINQAIPFLELSTQARSGFNESVSLGEVSEIQEDNSVALRIDLPSIDSVTSTPYWRMLVLDQYGDGRFRVSQSLKMSPLRKFMEARELRPSTLSASERSGALWTFYMEGGISRYLPVPGDFAALRFQKYKNLERIPDLHVYGIDSVGQNVFSYQLKDLKFNRRFAADKEVAEALAAWPLEVESQTSLDYPFTTLQLSLSESSLQALNTINRAITHGEAMSAADYSQSATDYLWGRFAYSLNPAYKPSQADDPIVAWLENGSQGHCELFAGAFILLAREAGFPARMVVGFAGGSWNSVEDYYVVRNREAHAWVEIYDPAAGNWLRVDPTPGSGSSDPEMQVQGTMAVESGWSAWVDSLRILWYRRIVNFEQQDQVELAKSLKDAAQTYAKAFKSTLGAWLDKLQSWMTQLLQLKDVRSLIVLLGLAASSYFAWRLRYAGMGLLFHLLRQPKAIDPVRRQASRYLQKMNAKGIHDNELAAELKKLRFGPKTSTKAAKPVFAKVRSACRRGAADHGYPS